MRKIIPIFVPHQGCVQRCIFCHQPHITGLSLYTPVTPDDIRAGIDTALNEPKSRAREVEFEVAFYGGTFTGLDLTRQEVFLRTVQPYVDQGKIRGIRLSTHPGMFTERIFELLAAFSVTMVELGVQSFDHHVLERARRGHTAEDAESVIKRLQHQGIAVGIHLMIGLPGDSHEISLASTDSTIALQPASVRIHPTLVIRQTHLATLYKAGQYTPLALEEAVVTCKDMLKRFQAHQIPVIRIGLQPTESMERNIVAGPYHPAFRQLVDSALMYECVANRCVTEGLSGGHLTITVAPQDIANIRGQKNNNLDTLRHTFGFTVVNIASDATFQRGEFRLSYTA